MLFYLILLEFTAFLSSSGQGFEYDISGVDNLTKSCEKYIGSNCFQLPPPCVTCFSSTCLYGDAHAIVSCVALVNCKIDDEGLLVARANFTWKMTCQFCFQAPGHMCDAAINCRSGTSVETTCTVPSSQRCMGSRVFRKFVRCNWCSGYSWWTALLLSVFLGGFGADRFYLGWWKEGIGKLFSFGGLGVWTVIDAILVAIGYLGPADGSLYT